MLALLCTAPQSTLTSPVEDAFTPFSRASASAPPLCAATSSSPTSSSKKHGLQLLGNPTRRPSIRKRIQSISRVSGASLDKATTSFSNAFMRHSSTSGSSESSSTTGQNSMHVRGASTSSSASKSSSSSSSSPLRSRLNVLNIGAPSAFKHQFHLGPDARTSDGPWDESRWRQVLEMRVRVNEDTPVIDVVSVPAATELPRASTSSDRILSHSQHPSELTNAAASSLKLLSSCASSPSDPVSTGTTPSSDTAPEDKPRTSRAEKRASLVKRKPVPPLYPEDAEPLPAPPTPNSPVPTTYVLIPDPTSDRVRVQVQGKGDVTAATTQKVEEKQELRVSSEPEQAAERKERAETTEVSSPKAVAFSIPTDPAPAPAPTHICVLRSAPPPTPPPRRHTLAHMQARALGRGVGVNVGLVPSLPTGPPVSHEREAGAKTMAETKETKSRRRPLPIVPPSAGGSAVEGVYPAFPPGIAVSATATTSGEPPVSVAQTEEEKVDQKDLTIGADPADVLDNSPRPSLSSLSSSSCGEGSSRSSSGSGSDSGEIEPRTPTDERRGSVDSALIVAPHIDHKTIVLAPSVDNIGINNNGNSDNTFDGSDTEDERTAGESRESTPRVHRRLRHASKRPNPPVRRVETNEDSVYVTADEADEIEEV